MKKLLLLTLLLCSCRSIAYQDVNPEIAPNENLLPPMETIVNLQNLEATYSSSFYNGQIYDFGADYTQNNFWNLSGQTGSISGTVNKDARVNDTINIFEKEVKQNITSPTGAKKGYISLKLGYRQNDSAPLFRLLSAFSFYTANLFGAPADKITQFLEVEVEIMNNKKAVIRRYVENVTNTEYVALYYGYNAKTNNMQNSVYRKVAADNIKQALRNIRFRINEDAADIKKHL